MNKSEDNIVFLTKQTSNHLKRVALDIIKVIEKG